MKKILTLVCNAHIDPVWLWQWEEGVAETLSTFRMAAWFCENYDGFVFNHNEALLYEYVETYDPELFEKIRTLVRTGKWHIMGGWYLQPDCNMPSTEAMIRQVIRGREYFMRKFSVRPLVAANLDSFGHSRGLVQILKKSGYLYYLFCRPDASFLELPGHTFRWIGYDQSEIVAHRADEHYNSEQGKAEDKIRKWIHAYSNEATGMMLWGIGNHGGGPSCEDLDSIEALKEKEKKWKIRHGTPEQYFSLAAQQSLPAFGHDLNPYAIGCYTSMARIKHTYRQLENEYFTIEKLAASASLQGFVPYPAGSLKEVLDDLLFAQFHDVLPGTSIEPVERDVIMRMHHGLEIINRLRNEILFRVTAPEKQAEEGEFPFFIYNPHPFDLEEDVCVEVQLPEPNMDPHLKLAASLYDNQGNIVRHQVEKESANIMNDHRKRIVFHPRLKASSLHRFSCYLRPVTPPSVFSPRISDLCFVNGFSEIVINPSTGQIDRFRISGVDYLSPGSGKLLIMEDSADPWGMGMRSFRKIAGEFRLMTPLEAAACAGISCDELAPVRVIEDGPVRTVVEALLIYNHSGLTVRYILPREGTFMDITLHLFWAEKDKMARLSFPTSFQKGVCTSEVMAGSEIVGRKQEELVAQKWLIVNDEGKNIGLSIINDGTFGFDFYEGEIRLALVRSPAYAGHPTGPGIPIVPQDRFEPRMDQGMHFFRFRLNAGLYEERINLIGREAQGFHEPPLILCCYPTGKGMPFLPSVRLSDKVVELLSFHMEKEKLIIRLFEPTGIKRMTQVDLPLMNMSFDVHVNGFEIKTFCIDPVNKTIEETDLTGWKITEPEK